MTLVSSIITDAYRESNLIPLVATPNANQVTEALRRLNTLLLSTVGNEAGDGLSEINIGGDYDEETLTNTWLPDNIRLMLNLTAAKTYLLDPYPQNGQRFAIVDVGGNLATYNVTIDGNGRRIEDTPTLSLTTDDLFRQWMYRSDTGNWVRIATVTDSDELPFPEEFDDYFITMLAIRINPRYGQELSGATQMALSRARRQLTARYKQTREVPSDVNPRGFLTDDQLYSRSGNAADFATGRAYPWR